MCEREKERERERERERESIHVCESRSLYVYLFVSTWSLSIPDRKIQTEPDMLQFTLPPVKID